MGQIFSCGRCGRHDANKNDFDFTIGIEVKDDTKDFANESNEESNDEIEYDNSGGLEKSASRLSTGKLQTNNEVLMQEKTESESRIFTELSSNTKQAINASQNDTNKIDGNELVTVETVSKTLLKTTNVPEVIPSRVNPPTSENIEQYEKNESSKSNINSNDPDITLSNLNLSMIVNMSSENIHEKILGLASSPNSIKSDDRENTNNYGGITTMIDLQQICDMDPDNLDDKEHSTKLEENKNQSMVKGGNINSPVFSAALSTDLKSFEEKPTIPKAGNLDNSHRENQMIDMNVSSRLYEEEEKVKSCLNEQGSSKMLEKMTNKNNPEKDPIKSTNFILDVEKDNKKFSVENTDGDNNPKDIVIKMQVPSKNLNAHSKESTTNENEADNVLKKEMFPDIVLASTPNIPSTYGISEIVSATRVARKLKAKRKTSTENYNESILI